MKFYIPVGAPGFFELPPHLGHEVVWSIGLADVVLFTGGADVSPSLYGDAPHKYTNSSSLRDERDCASWDYAQANGLCRVGVCRGCQFLHVMNGGKLLQHVDNHLGNHNMFTIDGRKIEVTSTHHQMINNQGEGELLAWARQEVASEYLEPEVMWYRDTKSLAVQYHPEYMSPDSQGLQYFGELLNTYLT